MKKQFWNLIIIAGAAFAFQGCAGTYATNPPPVYPSETIVVAPSPRHMWVPGRYVYRRNSYVWAPGYYRVPPRGRTRYVEGGWNHSPRGYRYHPGGWR